MPLPTPKPSVCRNADPDSDCQVDIDDNMIPVTYVGYDGNGGGHWAVVSDTDIQNNPGSWYNYRSGQWANAVTLKNDYSGGAICVYTNGVNGIDYRDTPRCDSYAGGKIYTPLEYAKAIQEGKIDADVSALFVDDELSVSNGRGGIILGYRVYIPRYAYRVQRRDASNSTVSAQNFDIVFELRTRQRRLQLSALVII